MTKKIRLYIQLLALLLMTVLAASQVSATELIPLFHGARPSQSVQLAHPIESRQLTAQQSPDLYALQPLKPLPPPGDQSVEMLRVYYNQSLQRLQQLPLATQPLVVSAKDNELQRLQKQQWNIALEMYRLTGLRLMTGLLDDTDDRGLASVSMRAIQLTLAKADLVTTTSDKLAVYEACSDIAARWQRDNQALERSGLGARQPVLEATYWRQYCEIQAMSERR